MAKVDLIISGTAIPDPGIGGWAAILRVGEESRELSGRVPGTTSGLMELEAVVRGLEILKAPCRVSIVAGSEKIRDWLSGEKVVTRGVAVGVGRIRMAAKQGGHELRQKDEEGLACHPGIKERCHELAVKAIHREEVKHEESYADGRI